MPESPAMPMSLPTSSARARCRRRRSRPSAAATADFGASFTCKTSIDRRPSCTFCQRTRAAPAPAPRGAAEEAEISSPACSPAGRRCGAAARARRRRARRAAAVVARLTFLGLATSPPRHPPRASCAISAADLVGRPPRGRRRRPARPAAAPQRPFKRAGQRTRRRRARRRDRLGTDGGARPRRIAGCSRVA